MDWGGEGGGAFVGIKKGFPPLHMEFDPKVAQKQTLWDVGKC